MSKLWTFGDSMTYGHGCRIDGPLTEYYFGYRKEGDDIWPNIVANEIDFECVNLGKCGCSNDIIIDRVIENFDKIESNDIVIIGKTFSHRYDIPYPKSKEWFTVIGHTNNDYTETFIAIYGQEMFELLINFCFYFSDHKKYKIRQDNRIEFLNKLLRNKNIRCIIWDVESGKVGIDRIINDTEGKLNDHHFSFKGHKQFAKKMIDKLNGKLL